MKDCVIINDISYFEYYLKFNVFFLICVFICGLENVKFFVYVNIMVMFYGLKFLVLKEFCNLGKLYIKNIIIMVVNIVSC